MNYDVITVVNLDKLIVQILRGKDDKYFYWSIGRKTCFVFFFRIMVQIQEIIDFIGDTTVEELLIGDFNDCDVVLKKKYDSEFIKSDFAVERIRKSDVVKWHSLSVTLPHASCSFSFACHELNEILDAIINQIGKTDDVQY